MRKSVVLALDCAQPIIPLIRSLAHDFRVVFIADVAGHEPYEGARDWLDDNAVPYDELHARLQGDERPTPEFKAGVLSYLKSCGHQIAFAIDSEAECWRANGIHCLQAVA
jgi:hypothetical protein